MIHRTEVFGGDSSRKHWNRLVWDYLNDDSLKERRPIIASLDDFIDVAAFAALSGSVQSDVVECERRGITDFFRARGQQSEIKKVYLTEPTGSRSHGPIQLADPYYWRAGELTGGLFAELKALVAKLPFKRIGRCWLIYSDGAVSGLEHSDHSYPTFQSEFVWLRLTRSKSFYVRLGEQREFVQGYAAWFDSRQLHAAIPSQQFAVSLRVDGEFEDGLRDAVLASYADRVRAARSTASTPRQRLNGWLDRLPGHRLAAAMDRRSWQRPRVTSAEALERASSGSIPDDGTKTEPPTK